MHPSCQQEMPAVFVDYALPNLVCYTGDRPWTNAPLSRRVPAFPNESVKADETWAAYVDEKDWGVGVYFPGKTLVTCYRALGDGKAGPVGSACSYFAPLETSCIVPGCSREYDLYVTIGDLRSIRKAFEMIHQGRK